MRFLRNRQPDLPGRLRRQVMEEQGSRETDNTVGNVLTNLRITVILGDVALNAGIDAPDWF